MQNGASDQGPPSQQQSLTRLHRRLQRLQDERIHLEGVLAHERSLLAQQRSDNAQLRSQLVAHSLQQAENAELHCLQTGDARLHMGVALQHQGDGVHAAQGQQHSASIARDHSRADLHDKLYQHDADSDDFAASVQQLEHQLLQLQAELALNDSEKTALGVQLAAQQAQHDSEHAALHAAFSAECKDSVCMRQQLDMLSHGRLKDSSQELHAAQEQCKACYKQVQVHGSKRSWLALFGCSDGPGDSSQALTSRLHLSKWHFRTGIARSLLSG